MDKDYKKWSELKSKINKNVQYPSEIIQGDIFWAALGENIGIEIDGKEDDFIRPVMIAKFFNKNHILIIPLTTNPGRNKYNIEVKSFSEGSFAITSQLRAMSSLRLQRFISRLNENDIKSVLEKTSKHLKYETLAVGNNEGISPPFGTNTISLADEYKMSND